MSEPGAFDTWRARHRAALASEPSPEAERIADELAPVAQIALLTITPWTIGEIDRAILLQFDFLGLLEPDGQAFSVLGVSVHRALTARDARYYALQAAYAGKFAEFYAPAYRPSAKGHEAYRTALFLDPDLASLLVGIVGLERERRDVTLQVVPREHAACFRLQELGLVAMHEPRPKLLAAQSTEHGRAVADVLVAAREMSAKHFAGAKPSALALEATRTAGEAYEIAAALAGRAVRAA